jgi:hypothetical protein
VNLCPTIPLIPKNPVILSKFIWNSGKSKRGKEGGGIQFSISNIQFARGWAFVGRGYIPGGVRASRTRLAYKGGEGISISNIQYSIFNFQVKIRVSHPRNPRNP